jgi:hypothetical protein
MKLTIRGLIIIGLSLLYLFLMLRMAGLSASEAAKQSPAAKQQSGAQIDK